MGKGFAGGGMNAGMIKQMQKLQQDMVRTQEEIESREFSASSGGGAVTAVVSGARELIKLTISPDTLDDAEMLQDMIITAVNSALKNAADTMAKEMQRFTGGLGLPF